MPKSGGTGAKCDKSKSLTHQFTALCWLNTHSSAPGHDSCINSFPSSRQNSEADHCLASSSSIGLMMGNSFLVHLRGNQWWKQTSLMVRNIFPCSVATKKVAEETSTLFRVCETFELLLNLNCTQTINLTKDVKDLNEAIHVPHRASYQDVTGSYVSAWLQT